MEFKFEFKEYNHVLRYSNVPIASDQYYKQDDNVVKRFITNFNSYTQLQEQIQTGDFCLYEILRDETRKLYFDIDKVSWTKEQCIENLKSLDEQIKVLLNVDNTSYVVLVNPGDEINSIHMIYKNVKLHYLHQKKLVQYLLTSKSIDFQLDARVYSRNRFFRLFNQTKVGKTAKFVFLEHYNKTQLRQAIMDSFITNSVKAQYFEFTKTFIDPNIETEKVSLEQLIEIAIQTPNIINNSYNWCAITDILHSIDYIEFDNWLEKSSIDTDWSYEQNKNYEPEQTINDVGLIYHIVGRETNSKFIQLESNEVRLFIEDRLDVTDDIDLIMDYINDPIEMKNDRPIKERNQAKFGNYYVNRLSGFIFQASNIENKTIINYKYDLLQPYEMDGIEFKNNIMECKDELNHFLNNDSFALGIKSSWGTGKTFHCLKYAIQHYLFDKVCIITCGNSLNKSNLIDFNKFVYDQIDSRLDPNAIDYDQRIGTLFQQHKFCSHLDKEDNLRSHSKVVCSVQSLHRLQGKTFDIVIMDEFEAIMQNYIAEETFNCKHSIMDSFKIFSDIANGSGKLLFMDADISVERYNILKSIVDSDKFKIIKNKDTSFKTTQYIIHLDKQTMVDCIIDELRQNRKIVMCSCSRGDLFTYLTLFGCMVNKLPEKAKRLQKQVERVQEVYKEINYTKILYIDKYGVKLYYTNPEKTRHVCEELDTSIYGELDTYIQKNKIDLVMYSPTIKCGISINDPYFDKAYCFASTNSVNYLEFIQMMMRVRILLLNEAHICIDPHHFDVQRRNIPQGCIKDNLHNIKELDDYIRKEDLEIFRIKTPNIEEEPYYHNQLFNIRMQINTQINIATNIFLTMKYHKLNMVYYKKDPNFSGDFIYNEIDKQLAKIYMYELWHELPFVSLKDYMITMVQYDNSKSCLFKEPEYEIFTKDPDLKYMAWYWKTYHMIKLFKMCMFNYELKNFINQLNQPHSKEFYTSILNIPDYLSNSFENELNQFYHSQDTHYLYNKYFHNKKYNVVYNCRKLATQEPRPDKFFNWTGNESSYIDKILLKRFMVCMGVDPLNPQVIHSNLKDFLKNISQDFETNETKMMLTQYQLSKKMDNMIIKQSYNDYNNDDTKLLFKTFCSLLERIDYNSGIVDEQHFKEKQNPKFTICPKNDYIKLTHRKKKQLQLNNMSKRMDFTNTMDLKEARQIFEDKRLFNKSKKLWGAIGLTLCKEFYFETPTFWNPFIHAPEIKDDTFIYKGEWDATYHRKTYKHKVYKHKTPKYVLNGDTYEKVGENELYRPYGVEELDCSNWKFLDTRIRKMRENNQEETKEENEEEVDGRTLVYQTLLYLFKCDDWRSNTEVVL